MGAKSSSGFVICLLIFALSAQKGAPPGEESPWAARGDSLERSFLLPMRLSPPQILPYSCGAAGGSGAAAFLRSMQEDSAFLISHSVCGTSSMMRSTGA